MRPGDGVGNCRRQLCSNTANFLLIRYIERKSNRHIQPPGNKHSLFSVVRWDFSNRLGLRPGVRSINQWFVPRRSHEDSHLLWQEVIVALGLVFVFVGFRVVGQDLLPPSVVRNTTSSSV